MRRLLPTVRSILAHSAQSAAVVSAGLLAMAAAPLSPAPAAPRGPVAVPEAPPVTAVARPAGPVMRAIAFVAPVRGPISSPFGLRKLSDETRARAHKGVDIAAPKGSAVNAAAEGVVVRTGYDAGGYGAFIEIRHPNGMHTLYGHLSRIDVAPGATVAAGRRIGLVGSTGHSTGPHLHFEVRRADREINPGQVMGRSFDVIAQPSAARPRA